MRLVEYIVKKFDQMKGIEIAKDNKRPIKTIR